MSFFNSDYETFIYKSRYARWDESKKRRENWEETVDRYISFIDNQFREVSAFRICSGDLSKKDKDILQESREAILNLDVMPSMRALMTAGKALRRDNTSAYNCSYLPIEDPKCFDEAMFILMCGSGVGYSVEEKYVSKLPEIPDSMFRSDTCISVSDSKEGWAKALRQLIAILYSGEIPKWDLSKIRPRGSILKTFGGRASGPDPLENLFNFVVFTFTKASGRRLSSIEVHDVMCNIAEVVVVGGVRRSAMISLSDFEKDTMRHAKSGQWWRQNPYRALANNSAVYETKPSIEEFTREWLSLVESKSGERGIFNRKASDNKVESIGRRKKGYEWGTNPCCEIILRPYQMCNLTEVVIRSHDTYDTLLNKCKIASFIGTIQSSLTNFPYLRRSWKNNAEQECLLGVSLTGIMDNEITSNKNKDKEHILEEWLTDFKKAVIKTNQEYAQKLHISESTATTCIKPSGTVSQLVNSSSGIHARHSPYYIRRVRSDLKDPISTFFIDNKMPFENCVNSPSTTLIFSFPQKSPENAVFRDNQSALDQLNLWSTYYKYWCEHKPSMTVSVRDDEWFDVGSYVYKNFDSISGISFLPYSDFVYRQAPYEVISKDTYEEICRSMPKGIDWGKLSGYEDTDKTEVSRSFSCEGNSCMYA